MYPPARLLVTGGRDFHNRKFVRKSLDELLFARDIEVVIHGSASGADSLANEWALDRGIPVIGCPADWDRYGRAAGVIRNADMLREHKPDVVIAFPGNEGTANMVSRVKGRIRLVVVAPGEEPKIYLPQKGLF